MPGLDDPTRSAHEIYQVFKDSWHRLQTRIIIQSYIYIYTTIYPVSDSGMGLGVNMSKYRPRNEGHLI